MNSPTIFGVTEMEEICIWCGRSVKAGSGLFVNRVPVCAAFDVNQEKGAEFPKGEWICRECDPCEKWRETPCNECNLRVAPEGSD